MLIFKKLLLIMFLTGVTQQGLAMVPNRVTMLERTTLMTTKLIKFAMKKNARYGDAQIDGATRTKLIVELERLFNYEKSPAC